MKLHFLKAILSVMYFLAAFAQTFADGGGDHSHGPAPAAPSPVATDVFIASAISENFETVLKYPPIDPGKASVLRLYISDFYTNAPINNAQLAIDVIGDGNVVLKPAYISPGTYLLSGTFPAKSKYSLEVTITSGGKSEMVSLPVETGKALPVAATTTIKDEGMGTMLILMIVGGILLLGLLAYFLKRKKIVVTKSKVTEVLKTADNKTLIVAAVISGAAGIYTFKAIAHEGEDHSADAITTTAPAGSEIAMSKETQFLLGVRTIVSDDGLMSQGVRVTGQVIPTTQGKAEVTAPQVGIIAANSALPSIGSYVRKGQVLAVLQQTLAASERIAATTELIGLKSNLMLAQRELERLKQLRRFISKKEIEIAEAEVRTARQAIESYEKLLSGTGSSRFEIVAPVSGTITMADVTRGEQVEAGKTLFEITDINSVWVEAQVSELDIAALQQTRSASFTVPAYPDEIFYGTLFTIGNVLDEQSRTVQAIFTVNNSGRLLKIGMVANVNIEVGLKTTAIMVLKDAVIDVSGKPTVFVHTEPEEFVAKTVTTGKTDGKMIEITSGLNEGERVVVTGNSQLKRMMLGI